MALRPINYTEQNGTILGALFKRTYASIGLFVPVFYLICYLCSEGYATTSEGTYLLMAFWAASIAYPSMIFYRRFPRFYRDAVSRMRCYGSVRWLFQWSFGCIVLMSALYLILRSFDFDLRGSIESHSIKPLIFAYTASLFLVFYLHFLVCNVVAEVRGVRTSKLS
jgi:TRAP-type uncharacterized transport system fused permease subunit